MKNVALHNLGCKVNSYELEVIQQMLQEKGYHIVPFDETADIYIINTCTVTNIADRKSRQMLHKAKAKNPDAIVVAMGCYVQTGGEKAVMDDSIDLAVGNNRKKDVVALLEEFIKRKEAGESIGHLEGNGVIVRVEETAEHALESTKETKEKLSREEKQKQQAQKKAREEEKLRAVWEKKTLGNTSVVDVNKKCEYEEMQLKSTAEHTRAYIKVQDGCNQFCSYCIIPFARGRVRSRKMEDILTEVRSLAKAGYKEVVLTGIHISSYGIDFDEEGEERGDYLGRSRVLDLVEAIQRVEGIQRIRLGSLEPRIITEENARRMAAMEKLCPHFHLSLQSGCNSVLKRMNRHYTTEEYYRSVELIRKVYEHPAITTDVIVGFPQETEEEFENTVAFLEKIRFYEMHVFKYSARQGTRAASMSGQLTEKEKTKRSARLLAMEESQSKEYRSFYLGREVEALFEEAKEINGEIYQIGHTPNYVKVALKTSEDLSNCLKKVRAEGFLTDEILNCNSVD